MQGSLYKVKCCIPNLLYFDTNILCKKSILFIGGLTDGLLALNYLNNIINLPNYSLIQVNLRSSYLQFGTSSIENDVEDLSYILEDLHEKKDTIYLMGHSTGCQISLALSKHFPKDSEIGKKIEGCILQAAVSDREAMKLDSSTQKLYEMALQCDSPSTVLPEMMYGIVPITAARMLSLGGRMTSDDYFSSDLTSTELKEKIGEGVRDRQVVVIQSLQDEYVPDMNSLQTFFNGTFNQVCSELGASSVNINYLNGPHNLQGSEEELYNMLNNILN